MSFVWFRKYQKPLLWVAVVFTVLVFATFSGIDDLRALLSGGRPVEVAGEFKVAGTGEVKRVKVEDFARTRTTLNRWAHAMQGGSVEDDAVWMHLMLLEDAKAAGLGVAPEEVSRFISGMNGRPWQSAEEYREFWSNRLQFSSAKEFERFIGDWLLTYRWISLSEESARIVDADEVYVRWRTDNELFDIDAVVVPDLTLEEVADPSPETLQAWWDEMPESTRAARFVEPQKQDIVYAWLPLDAGPDVLADEKLADIPEPGAPELEGRFEQAQTGLAKRWPDKTALDDEARAVLARESRLMAYVHRASQEFEELEEPTKAAFTEMMTAKGLKLVDPEGELGPDQLKTLEGIGDEVLQYYLDRKVAGDVHVGFPYAGQNHVEIVYLESVTPSRPLGFEDGHDQVVKAWKEQQRDKPAKEFRELVRTRTRARPEVAALIAPFVEAAQKRADDAVAARPELDEAGRAALHATELQAAESLEVLPRIAEHEHLEWAEVPLPANARRVELKGVPHNYQRTLDGEEAADSVERFLKTDQRVFRIAVDALSDPLRHGPSGSSVVVRVAGRAFPPKEAMLADPESLETSRTQLAAQRQSEARQAFSAERMKLSHELSLAQRAPEN
jgi:hypothetical protein